MKPSIRMLTLVLVCGTSLHAAESPQLSPKQVVNAFNKMAFEDRRPVEAVKKYFSPDFVEHDPTTAPGYDGLIEYFERRDWTKSTQMKSDIKHVIAEGDLVVVHHHVTNNPQDRGMAAVDIFRVKDGKVVEHWDVMQPVPEHPKNPNPMF